MAITVLPRGSKDRGGGCEARGTIHHDGGWNVRWIITIQQIRQQHFVEHLFGAGVRGTGEIATDAGEDGHHGHRRDREDGGHDDEL